ncbi:type II toxin-antitoxin system PemK/MazF family toxin [Phormidium sp. LEGE 05292]|uniref:type II toxin-antitoxin system PemK/MazF family toxin n=1 Tax=[Phormidium] sp. LEGE 05292 TaxID=767427 RepID=UPI00188302A5|nr:type II toxin-antitoxin system PemK/MazF family toxin [Phormidium sp. LEGE 05292]MBE9228287.1 type II toxin-antitoxin system PemK/MazF family toxin [Phormidium sp. LEGE 05292]
MGMVVNRFDVFLVNLDPTVGSEIQKTRPCVVISPDEMNRNISTVIVAPMTTKGQAYPTRIACQFQGKDGQIVLDRIRTVDKARLVKLLGQINTDEQRAVLDTLAEMFSE